MPESTWKYAQNQFLSVTDGRRPLMLTIGADHTAKLQAKLGSPADPDVQTCIDRVQPQYDDFQLKMVTFDVRSGTRKGQTEMVEALLQELVSQRVPTWDATVQLAYLPSTPQYTQIFPDGRAPFGSGKKDERILAVQTLAMRLAAFAEFATLQSSVEMFYASLDSARDTQQGSEGEIKSASDAAELARVALAIGLFANVGTLMAKHAAEPWRLEEYFELQLLRTSGGGSATPPGETGGTGTTFPFDWEPSEPTTVYLWFQLPAELTGAQTLRAVEGENIFTRDISFLEPGESVQSTWSDVTIDGEIDEVTLLDAEGNVMATGVRDPELPDPGP